MSNSQESTSGDSTVTSGTVGDVVNTGTTTSGVVSDSSDDNSALKGHAEKILKESKNKSARIADLENQLLNLKDAKLNEQQQFKQLAEQRLQQIQELESKTQAHELQVEKAKKLSSVKNHLVAMGLRPEHQELALNKLLDVEDLMVDPDTGSVLGAEDKAKNFRQQYDSLGIFGKHVPGVNQDAAKQGTMNKSVKDMSKKELQEMFITLSQ